MVNRSHHGAVVKCEATNDLGTTYKETTLDVHCEYYSILKIGLLMVVCSPLPIEVIWHHCYGNVTFNLI